jgi:hypothetical protein
MNLLALTRRLDKLIEERGNSGDACRVLIYDEHHMMRPAMQGSFTPQPEEAGLEAAYAAWGMKRPSGAVLVLPDNGHGSF